jgi:hypothetical protein
VEVVDAARHALLVITKQDFGTSRWKWRSWWDKNRGESRLAWLLAGLEHREAAVRASASDELKSLGIDTLVYHEELPARERDQARQKWAVWYKQQRP